MNPYRYRVSLRATHPSADLAPLFDALGLTPKRSWRAGQPRPTPHGNALAGVYRDSYGYAELTPDEQARDWSREHVEDFLDGVQQRLSMHRDRFHAFTAQGGRCGLFIGLFSEQNFGFEISPDLSAAMAALKLTLGFDIYPDPDD
ncbi:hypothetical protein ACFOLC_06765 [Lysobacter cavernae]|uniref:DUF4279 domain-containing protein n=1 Tax=Lysobacter cavernae TaxID=1685901 RepID=A0ABV7RPF6_9GAMM